MFSGYSGGDAAICTAAAASLLLAGPARADDTDTRFLAALTQHGITYSSPEQAIDTAHEVCGELDAGRQPADVAQDITTHSGLDGWHAGFLIGASIAAYCPNHEGDH